MANPFAEKEKQNVKIPFGTALSAYRKGFNLFTCIVSYHIPEAHPPVWRQTARLANLPVE